MVDKGNPLYVESSNFQKTFGVNQRLVSKEKIYARMIVCTSPVKISFSYCIKVKEIVIIELASFDFTVFYFIQ